jgi:DNA-nicking Smr family endonuclease
MMMFTATSIWSKPLMEPIDKIEKEQLEWIESHPPSINLKFPNGEPSVNRKKSVSSKKKMLSSKRQFPLDTEVDEELDLHGMTIAQGIAAVDEFLQMAGSFNLHCVRIIHGIGPEKGISMRRAIRKHLDTKCGRFIESKQVEGHNDGAVVVYVKKQKK